MPAPDPTSGDQRALVVDYAAFRARCHAEVGGPMWLRVGLDWALLDTHAAAGRVTVEVHRTAAASWRTGLVAYQPWYVDRAGARVEFDAADATPVRCSEVDATIAVLDEHTRRRIGALASLLERDGGIVEIVTFALGKNTVLVADGNHRLTAIYAGRGADPIPVTIVEHRIVAPLERALLTDLRHHVAE